jgi:hypothetical protein
VIAERSPERRNSRLFNVACFVGICVALSGLGWLVFHGTDHVPAPTGTTTTTFKAPPTTSTTSTTVQIVPLPANPNATPGGIPQPSFAPAP